MTEKPHSAEQERPAVAASRSTVERALATTELDNDMIVLARRVALGVFMAGLLALNYVVLHLFIFPVAWAILLAYLSWPLYRRLRQALGQRYSGVAPLVMTVLVGAVFVAPLIWLIALLRTELPLAYQAVDKFFTNPTLQLPPAIAGIPWLGTELQQFLDRLPDDPSALRAQLLQWARPWADEAAQILGDLGRNAVKFGTALLTLFFLYRYGENVLDQTRQVLRQLLGGRGNAYLGAIADTSRAVMVGLVLTALAQGFLAGLGYWLFGMPGAVLLGALTAILALIPFGPPLVWVPAGLWLISTGDWLAGAGLLVWGALAVSWIDNLVRPLVISGASKIPFLLVMFSVLGGVAAFGLLGLFLGPIAVAVLLAVWREWLDEHRYDAGSAS